MAEATDRPREAEELGAMTPISSESYRPLSLLALAGFGLAVLYALVVLIGAAVALFGHIPWLMSNWTFLLPVAALIVCWAARTRIRDAEETLSGLAFTTWGFRLTVVVGLTYAAYYCFTFFAVRLHAVDCAERFLEQVKLGHIEQAFLFSQGIKAEVVDNDLRNTLQMRFNSPMGSSATAGPFTRFSQMRFVRFLEMAGEQTNISLRGVNEWQYEKDGYRVVLKYHIATPLCEFDLHVTTFGRDAKVDEPKGRKWEVNLAQGGTGIIMTTMRMTAQGDKTKDQSRMAQGFASAWTEQINQQHWDEAYLGTLKPSQRKRAREDHPGAAALASRQLIHLDEKTFWAGRQQREGIIKRIRQTFQPGSAVFIMPQEAIPLIRVHEGQTTVFVDVSLRYPDENGEMQYIMEGRLVVSTEASDANTSLSAWHIESLDIESGRTPPAAARKRPPSAGAGMR